MRFSGSAKVSVTHNEVMSGGVELGGAAEIKLVPYELNLLDTAKRMLDSGEFGIAVIVAHMACEVATERALSRAWVAKQLTYLEEPVEAFLNGFNMGGNDRLRELYVVLTGKRIQDQPFWESFKTSSQRRNRIIHRGEIVSKQGAESSLQAATEFVNYVQ